MEEGGIPLVVTGTATGVVSVIGYSPDIFAPVMAGMILDAYPGAEGFQIFFLIIGGLSFVGLMAAYGVGPNRMPSDSDFIQYDCDQIDAHGFVYFGLISISRHSHPRLFGRSGHFLY